MIDDTDTGGCGAVGGGTQTVRMIGIGEGKTIRRGGNGARWTHVSL